MIQKSTLGCLQSVEFYLSFSKYVMPPESFASTLDIYYFFSFRTDANLDLLPSIANYFPQFCEFVAQLFAVRLVHATEISLLYRYL